MALIKIAGGAGEAEVASSPVVSLLNSLLAAGVRIRHDCGGKALCGTCSVRIIQGVGGLSPLGQGEALRLEAVGRGAGFRLACQTRAARDVEIEIPPD